MRIIFLLVGVMFLSGCSHWESMSDSEKQMVVIGTGLAVVAVSIAEQSHDVHNCISTRSLETGCPSR